MAALLEVPEGFCQDKMLGGVRMACWAAAVPTIAAAANQRQPDFHDGPFEQMAAIDETHAAMIEKLNA